MTTATEDHDRPRRSVTILGSTGSIGRSTVDLIARDRHGYEVLALTANTNAPLLAAQARRLGAQLAVVADPAYYSALAEALSGSGIACAAGSAALIEAARLPAEWVMAGIVGAAGLGPTLAAVRRKAVVALANKECLVCAGHLFMNEVAENEATLLPVDSEHNAIFQVFDSTARESVERIILTASGGPFRTCTRTEMARATQAEALAHPNWDMGSKISIDSATMMNKGLEIIEAHHLFRMPHERIGILVHPQSIVHSLVAYVDGSVLAQMGMPDMRTPISYCLAWPNRAATPSARLDLARISSLDFDEPDLDRFPAIELARQALDAGGAAPAVLNAANEVAVHAFLGGAIGFLDIPRIVVGVLDRASGLPMHSFDDVRDADDLARRYARELAAPASA